MKFEEIKKNIESGDVGHFRATPEEAEKLEKKTRKKKRKGTFAWVAKKSWAKDYEK